MASYRTHRPRAYGTDHIRTMLARWNGAPGAAVREYGPRIWPYTPGQALMGMSANSTGATEALTLAGFWEVGLFNTPGGSPSQPAATGGSWASIARSQAFIDLVGREGVIGDGWQTAIVDQVVIGLLDYHRGIQIIASRIPADLRPTAGTQWEWACGVFGYVTSTGAIAAINEHANFLRGFDESRRFGALLAATAEAGFTSGKSGTAYPMVRAWQRLECGRALTEQTGGDLAWFELGLGQYIDAVEHRITVAYYGAPDGPVMPGAYGPVGTEVPGGGGRLVLGVAALVLGGWAVKKALEGRKRERRRR